MGSSHDFEIAHRGQEPATTNFCCICNKSLHKWRRRFMERGHLQNSDVNRSHEPIGIPLNRPPGTFSPTGGEGWDEGVRFMEGQPQPADVLAETGARTVLSARIGADAKNGGETNSRRKEAD